MNGFLKKMWRVSFIAGYVMVLIISNLILKKIYSMIIETSIRIEISCRIITSSYQILKLP